MKKLIKLDFNNTTRERKTEDSYSELYSYDKNNGLFEFEILNDTLTTEQVTALFKFTESNKIWKTTGTVEGNKVKVTFDTTLITQNETVICYLYFDEEQRTSDTFRFKFKVKVSEIDKMSRYEVKERFINNTVIVDRLDVVTKDELKEALKNVGGIATEGLLTEVKAEELYAKKSEAVDNTNFELVKNRVLALELKTDKDTVYDDSELKGRISLLEAKEDKNTIYDDTPLKERVTALESKAIEGGAYDDSDLRNRVVALESKEDKDTKYDDTDLKNRVTNLENKPPLDTSEFVTNQALESKGYIKDVSNLVTKDELTNKGYLTTHQSLDNVVTKEELATKGYITDVSNLVTKDELESKNYLTTPYNDTPLKERVAVLENKVDKDTIYNDTELRNRVEVLENKPNVDLSNYVTNEQLENKGFIKQHQELSHLATTSDLEALRNIAVSKAELSKKLDTTEYNSFKDSVVTKTELAEKGYLTTHQDISNLATKQEVEDTYAKKTDLPTPYNDSALVQKIGQLEARVDKDTVYNDAELKRRVTALEEKPNVDTSNFVTTAILESKGYLTSHQDTSNFALKSELPQPYNDSALVSRINVLEAKTDNDTIYNDAEVKQRLTALESRPTSQSEMRGTGMPNGVVEAPIGATYIDTAKTNGALKWIKTTDGGNTGWKVVEGDTGWVLSWQENIGKNKNRMYFRRKNDVVHVKFNPEISNSDVNGNTNLILQVAGYYTDGTLSIDGFKPVDDVVQTIYGTSSNIYSNTASAENSEGAQGTGAVIIQYEYYPHDKTGLKLQIVTSDLGEEENHVNPFSYLTEDEWPVQLP